MPPAERREDEERLGRKRRRGWSLKGEERALELGREGLLAEPALLNSAPDFSSPEPTQLF